MTYALIIVLFILAYMIINPVLSAIVYGLLLAYIMNPVYNLLKKIIKNEIVSAFIVCIGLFIIIIGALVLIIGSLLNQAIDFYLALKSLDLTSYLSQIPWLAKNQFSATIISNINSTISNFLFNFLGIFNKFVLNLPELGLKFVVFLFVFFFALKDGERAINYLKSVSPLKKENEEKFFKKFKDVTNSVLLGQIFVGLIQGLVAGVGFFIFGVKNPLILTFLSIGASIIPMVGPWLVWIPVNLFLILSGRPETAIGFLIYNLFITSLIDNVVRPFIVSRKTEINTGIIIIGMVGGFFVFGFLGLIIGPLILSYVLLVIEIYRKRNFDESSATK